MPEQGGGERKNKYGNSKAINYWDKARWCGCASEERDAAPTLGAACRNTQSAYIATEYSLEVKDMGFGTDCLVFTFLKLLKNGKDA